MRVLEHDEDHWPWKGHLVLHAPTDDEFFKAETNAPRAVPRQPYYSFRAIPDITSGPIYEREVKKFI